MNKLKLLKLIMANAKQYDEDVRAGAGVDDFRQANYVNNMLSNISTYFDLREEEPVIDFPIKKNDKKY